MATDFDLVSVIIPVYNVAPLRSRYMMIEAQYADPLVDSFTQLIALQDNTPEVISKWETRCLAAGFRFVRGRNDGSKGRGCGFAKNRAVEQSHGAYLCFLDADDAMLERRIELQYEAARKYPDDDVIVGCQFRREPADATPRYTQWCNSLTSEQLITQQFRDTTVIQPTWFFSRRVFDKVGGYDEGYPGVPEDLLFFYAHLRGGGKLHRVDSELLLYRFHPESTCLGIHRLTLLKVRIAEFERRVLPQWKDGFAIWGCGRDGRKFYMNLSTEAQKQVKCFLEIDEKKIGTFYTNCWTQQRVPIVDWHEAPKVAPFVTCVALDRGDKQFEKNVESLGLVEGKDFLYFT